MDTLTVCKETLSLRSRRLDGSSGRKRERAPARETRKGVRELSLPSRVSSRASGFFWFFFPCAHYFQVPGGERVESYAARAKRNTRTGLSVKITKRNWEVLLDYN